MAIISIKLKESALPSNIANDSKLKGKAFFIVAPYSTIEHEIIPYNSMKYYKHNREILDRRNILCGTAPVFATVYEGMYFDDKEFELVMKSPAYGGILSNVSNGTIEVKNEDTSTVLTFDDLMSLTYDRS